MDFVVTAIDAPGSLDRRLAHRDAHLEGARRLAASGNLVSAGAILDEDGRMAGSTLHMRFASRDELQDWLDADPYVVGEVWAEIDVREIRLVDFAETGARLA